jgi:hypothetical protein
MKTTPEAPAPVEPTTLSPDVAKPSLAGDIASRLGALFEPTEASEAPAASAVENKKESAVPVADKGKEASEGSTEDAPITLDSLILDVEDASLVVADDDEIPAFVKGEEAVSTWKGLKQAEKAARAEAETLKAQVEDLKSATSEATTQELEALRTRVIEQEKALLASRIEESDEYRTAVTRPLQQIEKDIMGLVGDDEVANAVFDGMLTGDARARAEKISDAVSDLSPMAQNHIYALIKDYDKVIAHRETIRQKASEAKAEIERATLEKQSVETAEQKKIREAATNKIWENITKTLPFMVDEEGAILPEYQQVLAKAKQGDITRAAFATQAFAPIAIHLVPQLAEMLKKKDGEIASLAKQVSRLTGASPSSMAFKDRGSSETAVKPLPKGGLAVALAEKLAEAGVTRN